MRRHNDICGLYINICIHIIYVFICIHIDIYIYISHANLQAKPPTKPQSCQEFLDVEILPNVLKNRKESLLKFRWFFETNGESVSDPTSWKVWKNSTENKRMTGWQKNHLKMYPTCSLKWMAYPFTALLSRWFEANFPKSVGIWTDCSLLG